MTTFRENLEHGNMDAGFCSATHYMSEQGCYGLPNHRGSHFDDVQFDPALMWENDRPVDLEAQRADLVLLSYEGAHDPLNKSPYPRRKFDELPQWQKDWHERVADLVLKAGFRKEV